MFFQVRIFFQSILFLVVLEIATSDSVGNSLASALYGPHWWAIVLMSLLLAAYFYFFSRRIAPGVKSHSIVTVFFLSSLGLLYFVNSDAEQNILVAFLALIFYFLEISLYRLHKYKKDETALGIFAACSIATAFLAYAFFLAAYLNFAIPLWFLMLVFLIVTTSLSYQSFSFITDGRKQSMNYALVAGFAMAEIVWIISFWPFGYLTTAVITLTFYYVFWDMMLSNFLGRLSKKRIVTHLVIISLMIVMVLASSHWLPVF